MATVIDGTSGSSIAGAGSVVGNFSVGSALTVTGTSTLPTIKSSTSNTPPTIQDSAGTQIGTFCRAWVNFNGTTNVGGFCTIRASFNVTSVADNGTGDYTVNFTTAMPDADYAAVASGNETLASFGRIVSLPVSSVSASSIRLRTSTHVPALIDFLHVSVAIFR